MKYAHLGTGYWVKTQLTKMKLAVECLDKGGTIVEFTVSSGPVERHEGDPPASITIAPPGVTIGGGITFPNVPMPAIKKMLTDKIAEFEKLFDKLGIEDSQLAHQPPAKTRSVTRREEYDEMIKAITKESR